MLGGKCRPSRRNQGIAFVWESKEYVTAGVPQLAVSSYRSGRHSRFSQFGADGGESCRPRKLVFPGGPTLIIDHG